MLTPRGRHFAWLLVSSGWSPKDRQLPAEQDRSVRKGVMDRIFKNQQVRERFLQRAVGTIMTVLLLLAFTVSVGYVVWFISLLYHSVGD